ncbi:hypothetical protein KUCAC02_037944 [Chaenocephalus aceratus]|nr:hypothetical protein KUCAC02_037944 [Chaenocephalus aceratus]
MAAKDFLRGNKTSIVKTLCADYTIILNKADEKQNHQPQRGEEPSSLRGNQARQWGSDTILRLRWVRVLQEYSLHVVLLHVRAWTEVK